MSIIVAFLVAVIVMKISFIPFAIVVFVLDNINWPEYLLGALFFVSLIIAIWAGIAAFKPPMLAC
jgi:hypothetical protein